MSVRIHGEHGSWLLPEGDSLLGRSQQCQIRIDDPRLSRQHAFFRLAGNDLMVRDAGSVNGVLVNGEHISAECKIRHGDVVVCGPCVLMVSVDVTQPHPRQPEGGQHPPTRRLATRSDTEAMAPLVADDHLPPARPIDPAIAAAINPNEPLATTFQPADAPDSLTGPLAAMRQPLPPTPKPAPRRGATSSKLSPDNFEPAEVSALDRPNSGEPECWRRIVAGVLDCLTAPLLACALALPIAASGYGLALVRAKATLIDGLPALGTGAPASWGAIVASLLHPGGLGRAGDLLAALRTTDTTALGLAFGGATLAIMVAVLTMLLVTVAATVLSGAPFWHRRFGLMIVAVRGGYLGWGHSLLRWTALGVLWPTLPVTCLLRRRGLHDWLTGCAVRRRA